VKEFAAESIDIDQVLQMVPFGILRQEGAEDNRCAPDGPKVPFLRQKAPPHGRPPFLKRILSLALDCDMHGGRCLIPLTECQQNLQLIEKKRSHLLAHPNSQPN
jgi:hypothetical protein